MVAQRCAILRTQSKSPVGVDIKARLAAAIGRAGVNETNSIGVVAADQNACYSATLHKVRTEAGPEEMLVVLHAATILGKRAIGVGRSTVYQNPDTINAVLAELKDNVAALIAANP